MSNETMTEIVEARISPSQQASAFLMMVIMAMATRAVGQAAALAIGATVGLEALFAGPICGASMNPARSLGPAIVSWTWTAQWIYIVGPMIGAVAGAYVYRWLREASQHQDLSYTVAREDESHKGA